MNGPFYPIFDNYDDGFFGGPFRSRINDSTFSRRRSYEEAQRRAEIERYNRLKKQEQLRKQREQEIERYNRVKKQEQLRKQREQEMRRRREYEAFVQRRREAEEQERLRRQRALAAERASCQTPRYSVVRGPDGYLYRVPTEYRQEENDVPEPTRNLPEKRKKNGRKFIRGMDGRIYLVHDSSDDEPMGGNGSWDRGDGDTKMATSPLPSPSTAEAELQERVSALMKTETIPDKPTKTVKKTKPRRCATVVAEDASDSEYENDEMKSIWRNRRPGLGDSWMEPIS